MGQFYIAHSVYIKCVIYFDFRKKHIFYSDSVRMSMVLALSVAGYILVAAASTPWVAVAGVVCTAFASGLGEATLLSYMAFYKNK